MAQDLSSVAQSAEEQARSAKEEPWLQPWQFFLLCGMLGATALTARSERRPPMSMS